MAVGYCSLRAFAIGLALLAFHLNERVFSVYENDQQFYFFNGNQEKAKSLLSPRVDYNEWTPLGRGDPLKNDPTFDYSPPTLDRVKYWMNPLLRTPDPPIVLFPTEQSETPAAIATTSAAAISKLLLHKQNNKQQDIKRFFDGNFKTETPSVYLYNRYNNLQRPAPVIPQPSAPSQFQANNGNLVQNRPRPSASAPLPVLLPPLSVHHRVGQPAAPQNNRSVGNGNAVLSAGPTSLPNDTRFYNPQIPFESAVNFVTLPPAPSSGASSKFSFPVDGRNNFTVANGFGNAKSSTSSSYLHALLGKEASSKSVLNMLTTVVASTTESALTVDLHSLRYKQRESSSKSPMHVIIQGHSKVKKYGNINELEKLASDIQLQDTNEIGAPTRARKSDDKWRESRKFKLEDLLPFEEDVIDETFKDIVEEQAEGSGFGAILTKAIFPLESYNKSSAEHRIPKNL